MRRLCVTFVVLLLASAVGRAAGTLDITFIDTEGGQATLIVTPAGQSLLIDAGYANRGQRGAPPLPPGSIGRDASRILTAAREAGLSRIDYLLVTHFHSDHAGGVPDLAGQIPIGTFIDYGMPLGTDRLTQASFRAYEPIRDAGRHVVARVGERIPLSGVSVEVVSADGKLRDTPMGAGEANAACVNVEDHVEDGTENYRSVGVMVTFGAFRFLDLGDLSGNTLTRLACPRNILGPVSVYLTAHHGDYDATVPALFAALAPRVVVMNNGVYRGGHSVVFRAIRAQRAIEDLWQLHFSRNEGAENAPDAFLANVDDGTETGFALRLTAREDGGFTLRNSRNGFVKDYGNR